MRILNIALFSKSGQERVISFNADGVSVITGASKTGKSALISIVDYCFGSSECNVPDGPIRRATSWYVIRIALSDSCIVVGRKNPERGRASSQDCFFEHSTNAELPVFSTLAQTTNVDGLKNQLSKWAGIDDNLHETPQGQSRPDLTANIRHALAFCFQSQDEIIRSKQLFRGSENNFVAQSIKDTLPYFLGAVTDDYVEKRGRRRQLGADLRAKERLLAELTALSGNGVSKAADLLAEARSKGLTDFRSEDWAEIVVELKKVSRMQITDLAESDGASKEYDNLSGQLRELNSQQSQLENELARLESFSESEGGFSIEASEQRARLSLVKHFDETNKSSECALCNQSLPVGVAPPAVSELNSALREAVKKVDFSNRTVPGTSKLISEIRERAAKKRQEKSLVRSQMSSVVRSDARLTASADENAVRAFVIGRIEFFVENIPEASNHSELLDDIALLKSDIEGLDKYLSDENVQERVDSILSVLAQQVGRLAGLLSLEHGENPHRLDLKKLTVIADTIDGAIPMSRMGSGESWVSYHIIVHIVLHSWFISQKRPVPQFLFLDQPSQVYFPDNFDAGDPALESAENDWDAVTRMFKVIFDFVREQAPELQIIITEHADLKDDWYQKAVVEKWRDGEKLIPAEWLN